MVTMDAKQVAALREPFPGDVVGKLPKSTCRLCSNSPRKKCDQHGWTSHCQECKSSHSAATIHLDFVGHAAVTNRLLNVDPHWSWEPFALDPQTGMPGRDREGNMWIRLTVAGVTRIGVGDGKSAKECIGDAIRNAAMRFGVALDLWTRNDLEQVVIDQAAADESTAPEGLAAARANQSPAEPPVAQQAPSTPAWEAPPATDLGSPLLNTSSALARRMYALFGEVGISEQQARLDFTGAVIGRAITTSRAMTERDARNVIAALEERLENPFPHPPEEK